MNNRFKHFLLHLTKLNNSSKYKGSYTIELSLIMPTILLIIILIIKSGLYFYDTSNKEFDLINENSKTQTNDDNAYGYVLIRTLENN